MFHGQQPLPIVVQLAGWRVIATRVGAIADDVEDQSDSPVLASADESIECGVPVREGTIPFVPGEQMWFETTEVARPVAVVGSGKSAPVEGERGHLLEHGGESQTRDSQIGQVVEMLRETVEITPPKPVRIRPCGVVALRVLPTVVVWVPVGKSVNEGEVERVGTKVAHAHILRRTGRGRPPRSESRMLGGTHRPSRLVLDRANPMIRWT